MATAAAHITAAETALTEAEAAFDKDTPHAIATGERQLTVATVHAQIAAAQNAGA